MSWREFDLTIRGYFLRWARQKWMFRELIWNVWASTAASDFNLTRQQIMLLPWDEPEPPVREYTSEEIAEINERFDRAAEAFAASTVSTI